MKYYSQLRQLLTYTSANLRSRYRRTWAGLLWVILHPVITFGIQSYVFKIILKIPVDGYPLFLLLGLLPWIFFSQSLEMCAGIIVNQGRLLKSFPIHPLVLIGSQILDNFINFALALLVMLIPLIYLMDVTQPRLLILILPMVPLIATSFGGAMILSLGQVYFTDIKFVTSFALQVLYFLTPIFYPESFVDSKYWWILAFNPLYYLLKPFQLLRENGPLLDFFNSFGQSLLISTLTLIAAVLIWRRHRNDIYFRI